MQEINQLPSEVVSALIAASVAVLIAAGSVIAQIVLWYLDKRAQRSNELLSKRRDALLLALRVIDHVYANSEFDKHPPNHPHEWDINLAREAMSGMVVFCKNPEKTVGAFAKAIGLHNPGAGQSGAYGIKDLAAFRKAVCEELGLSAPTYDNQSVVWISSLPGGK